MLRIQFDNDDDRAAVYDYASRHRECGVLTLNMTHNRLYQVPVALTSLHIPPVTHSNWRAGPSFDLDVEMMHIRRVEPVEVPDDVAVLKAQLAARDAALTAVLAKAHEWVDLDEMRISAIPVRRCGTELAAVLASHGVHK
jgi:hypothetical protein